MACPPNLFTGDPTKKWAHERPAPPGAANLRRGRVVGEIQLGVVFTIYYCTK
jgi:hypothetical protein